MGFCVLLIKTVQGNSHYVQSVFQATKNKRALHPNKSDSSLLKALFCNLSGTILMEFGFFFMHFIRGEVQMDY